jgi:hypothetical protein
MVSSPASYEACADVIAEAVALVNNPRFFYLGMDEENLENHVNVE